MKITWLVRRAGRKGGVQDKKSKSYRIESNLLLVWRTNSNKSRCASCADGMEPLKLFLRELREVEAEIRHEAERTEGQRTFWYMPFRQESSWGDNQRKRRHKDMRLFRRPRSIRKVDIPGLVRVCVVEP